MTTPETHDSARAPTDTAVALLNNRGLEPPMPMVRTLEAYGALAPGASLRIHNDRVPVYLLPQLDERGASCEIDEQEDGSAIVTIHKPLAEPAGSPTGP